MTIRTLSQLFAILGPTVCATFATTPASATVPLSAAAEVFETANDLCEHDDGALWGRSLCGPILLVDPTDRRAVANQQDPEGRLRQSGTLFVGEYAEPAVVSNTPTSWSGIRWTQMVWPIQQASDFFAPVRRNRWSALFGAEPSRDAKLRVLLAHEMFHRVQSELGLDAPDFGNRHLDSFRGRYLLQLEWRALAEALASRTRRGRATAIADALLFRSARHHAFASAAKEEAALEIAEGIPEYTGVKLGLTGREEQTRYAIYDLASFAEAPTFVRSFAYATGPAYGLLLDLSEPKWRSNLKSGKRLDELLAASLNIRRPGLQTLSARAAVYGASELRARETQRETKRQKRLGDLRVALVEGRVLKLPLRDPSYTFNPQTVEALDGVGTVYPTATIGDAWGRLEVAEGGVLIENGMHYAVVTARDMHDDFTRGRGWKLTLKRGWRVVNGERRGDLVVRKTTP